MRQGRGRKHIPTDKDRKMVEEMAAVGVHEDRICLVLDIGQTALRRYYHQELAKAQARADHLVGRSLVHMAAGGPDGDWRQAVPVVAIFYAKTRMGWRVPDPWGDERDEQGVRIVRVINSPEQGRLNPPRPERGNGADHDPDSHDLDLN